MNEPPTEFHWHELLDRVSCHMSNFDNTVMDHPVLKNFGDLDELAQKAHVALFDLYQAIGKERFNAE